MTEKKDDSLAFPHTEFNSDGTHYATHTGMTLRDYFAGMVLAGISGQALENASRVSDAEAAVVSYALADAMLTERAKRGEP